jgi:type I restriction-modification system, S subunit
LKSFPKSITQKGLDESSAKLMPEGSIIYSSRAPIGHIAIAAHELCTNQGCKSFVPDAQFITTEWAYYMLIARTRDIQSRASGTTFKEISGKGVGETWVSLPPIAEQQRIVAKVEELLKQVDTLSA